MNISLNRNSKISLIKQIQQTISDRIRSGKFENGSQLPSIRTLSKELGVSMVTVSKAYSSLEQENLIIRIKGKGTFVHTEKHVFPKNTVQGENINPYAWQISIPDYLPRTTYYNHQHHIDRYQFASSKIDPKLLPNQFLEKEVSIVLKDNPTILSTYGDIQGDLALRMEIAAYLKKLGISTKSDQILIINGVQQGIDLVARTFLGSGDVVLVEAPTYSGALDVFRNHGAMVLSVPIDQEGMRMDILERLCRKFNPKIIYTNPTFQNPTGTVLSPQRRMQLINIAQENGVIIIEDDSWSEIYFEDPPPLPIKTLDDSGHVVYLKGFSKILSPGCRIGALIANGTIFNRLVSSKSISDLGSPILNQKIILALLKSERMSRHIEKLRIALSLRAEKMMDTLNQYAPKAMTWRKASGGLNLWISGPYWFHSETILPEAQKRGLHFLPSSVCYPGEPEYNSIRLCFSYMNEKDLEEGTIILCKLLAYSLNKKQNKLPIIG